VISITECKKKLNRNGIKYTDEEVELIRNILYKLADIYHSNQISTNEEHKKKQ